jgi:nucleotide-binding universal stress UspA family protein
MNGNIVGQPIVVGVDGSASALNAALWAADEAAQRRVPLRLGHAVDLSTVAYTGGFAPPLNYFDDVESAGRIALAEADAAIRKAHPDLNMTTALYNTTTARMLIDESDSARLLVLGSRGLGGFAGMLAGSNAVALVTHGHCPVAVIRGTMPDALPPTHGPVVVGVDGSPASEVAVGIAFDEASLRGVDLIAVHTWVEFTSDSAYAYARQFMSELDDVEAREAERLAQRLAGWQEKYPDVTVRRIVTRDRPVRCLLAHAADAQLLVVGSRGHGGFTGMLLGSTSQALIYHAPCPLIVARPTTS